MFVDAYSASGLFKLPDVLHPEQVLHLLLCPLSQRVVLHLMFRVKGLR